MIYRETEKPEEYQIKPETFWERLWVSWLVLRYPRKYGMYIKFKDYDWVRKNCNPIRVMNDTKNLKHITGD